MAEHTVEIKRLEIGQKAKLYSFSHNGENENFVEVVAADDASMAKVTFKVIPEPETIDCVVVLVDGHIAVIKEDEDFGPVGMAFNDLMQMSTAKAKRFRKAVDLLGEIKRSILGKVSKPNEKEKEA